MIALSIGTQHLALAVFESRHKKWYLKKYGVETLDFDGVSIRPPIQEIEEKIKLLKSRLKISEGQEVRYVLSGQTVILRFSKIHIVDGQNFTDSVAYEAQQQFPFPLDGVVWGWDEFNDFGTEKEVVFAAIKKEILEQIHQVVEKNLGIVSRIELGQTALLKSFLKISDLSQSRVLIDFGVKTTSLFYCSQNSIFSRILPFGGASLTGALAQVKGISFLEAENLKIGSPLESLEEQKLLEDFIDKQGDDIQRAFNDLQKSFDLEMPARVSLVGKGKSLKGFISSLKDLLGLEFASFSLVNTQILEVDSSLVIPKEDSVYLAELLGVCLEQRPSVELLPEVMLSRRSSSGEMKRKKIFSISLLAGISLLLLCNTLFLSMAKRNLDSQEAKLKQFRPYIHQIQNLNVKEKGLIRKSGDLIALEQGRVAYSDIFDDLSRFFSSPFTWLVKFEPLVISEGKRSAFRSLLAGEFASKSYGKSALNLGRANLDEINAISIRGFWFENPKGYQIVYDLLENLLKNASWLSDDLKKQDKDSLREKIIMRLMTQPKEGRFAGEFELLLPLHQNFLPAFSRK